MAVSENNIHIPNSWEIETRKQMRTILMATKVACPECKVFRRSMRSLVREWRAHNLLFSLRIKPERTRDVDLDYPAKWYTEIGYFVLSLLYPHL